MALGPPSLIFTTPHSISALSTSSFSQRPSRPMQPSCQSMPDMRFQPAVQGPGGARASVCLCTLTLHMGFAYGGLCPLRHSSGLSCRQTSRASMMTYILERCMCHQPSQPFCMPFQRLIALLL